MAYITTVVLDDFTLQADCLEFMFANLADRLDEEKLSDLKEAVYTREDTASTFIDEGLAVPHGRIRGLDEDIIMLGISRCGIDWPEPDRKAHIVVLVGVDRTRVSAYLSILQKIIKWKRATKIDFDNFDALELENSLKEFFK